MTQHRHGAQPDALAPMALASAAWRKSSYSGNAGSCVETAALGSARWHKSSYSDTQGNCVEVAGLEPAEWRKSSRSGNQGNCVEVAGDLTGAVAVRDSKNPGSPALVFTSGEWSGFVTRVRRGEFGRS